MTEHIYQLLISIMEYLYLFNIYFIGFVTTDHWNGMRICLIIKISHLNGICQTVDSGFQCIMGELDYTFAPPSLTLQTGMGEVDDGKFHTIMCSGFILYNQKREIVLKDLLVILKQMPQRYQKILQRCFLSAVYMTICLEGLNATQ